MGEQMWIPPPNLPAPKHTFCGGGGGGGGGGGFIIRGVGIRNFP